MVKKTDNKLNKFRQIELEENIKTLRSQLTDDSQRIKLQFRIVYLTFVFVSLFMTILNIFSPWKILMNTTALYTIANVVNYFLARFKKTEVLARILFAVESAIMFISFIVIGQPEGFSAIWIALLPIGGMLLFRKKYGSFISLSMFVVLAFFFWTPWGQSLLQYDYTESFKQRFPVLYFSFFAVGFCFEVVREYTQTSLNELKDKFVKLSYNDQLTKVLSNTAYLEKIELINKDIQNKVAKFKIVFIDANGIKEANDKYGHRYGTQLIVETAKTTSEIFKNSEVYRIGGDEFIVVIPGESKDYNNMESLIKEFDKKLELTYVNFQNKKMVLSVARGVAEFKNDASFNNVFQRADKAMYKNKKELKEKYGLWSR